MKSNRRKRKKIKNTVFTDLNAVAEENEGHPLQNEVDNTITKLSGRIISSENDKQRLSTGRFAKTIYQDSSSHSIVRAKLKSVFLKSKISKTIAAETTKIPGLNPRLTNDNSGAKTKKRRKLSPNDYILQEEISYFQELEHIKKQIKYKKHSDIRCERGLVPPKFKRDTLCLILTTAEFIAREGSWFEAYLKEKEILNPDYSWLFDEYSPQRAFMQQRVLQLLYGQSKTVPFKYFDSDWIHYKPELTVNDNKTNKFVCCLENCTTIRRSLRYSSFHNSYQLTGKKLGRELKHEFRKILKPSSLNRIDIMKAMGFCITQSDCFQDCIQVVCLPFHRYLNHPNSTSSSKQSTKFLHRLYILSDCLFNTHAKLDNNTNYLVTLRACLPLVFFCLGVCKHQASGRITAQTLSLKVEAVLKVWRDNFLFQTNFLTGLHLNFNTVKKVSRQEAVNADVKTRAEEFGIFCRFRSCSEIEALIQVIESQDTAKINMSDIDKYRESLIDPKLDGQPLTESD